MTSRTLVAALLALALAAPTAAAEPLVNQIDNGGFEAWSADDPDDPDEWRLVEGVVERTDDAAEGDSAARLNSVGDVRVTTIGQNVSLDRTDAPIVPNGTYDLDFAALLEAGSEGWTTAPPDGQATVLWKDAFGEVTDVDVVPVQPSSSYVAYNVTLDAPLGATEAEVQFTVEREQVIDRTDGHLQVDDVAFGPALPA